MRFHRELLLVALSFLFLGSLEAQDLGLQQVFGNGQAVKDGTSFALGVRALGPGNVPQAGVRVFAASVIAFGPTLSCADGTTGPDGLGVVICNVGAWPFTTGMIITVGDDLGRLAPPFSIRVNPLTRPDGLIKTQGDFIRVPQNTTFDLGVAASINGAPQVGITLDIVVDPADAPIVCPATALTDANGEALIVCQAGAVDFPTTASVTIRDAIDRFATFNVTVLPQDALTDGLFKVSGDNQAVPAGASFPVDLIALVVTNGLPHEDVTIDITNSAPSIVFCPLQVKTDGNGQARIRCITGPTVIDLAVEIHLKDEFGRLLAEPFRASIVRAPPQTATRLELVSDRNLSVEAGETVEDAIVVRALTREFLPANSAVVYFNSNLNATFDPPIAITRADGKASSTVTFGCPGARGVIGAGLVEGFRNSVVTTVVSNGGTSRLRKLQGDGQVGPPGALLRDKALLVELTDLCLNPITLQPITWTVDPPSAATLESVFTPTNGAGRSSVLVRMGANQGSFVVRAKHANLVAEFNLEVAFDPVELVIPNSSSLRVPRGELSEPLVVRLVDGNGSGVRNRPIAFVIAQGDGELTDAEVLTDANGEASTTFRGGMAPGLTTVVATLADVDEAEVSEKVRRVKHEEFTATFDILVGGLQPLVTRAGIVNGANFRFGLTPGGLVSIFGTAMSEDVVGSAVATSVPLPTDLVGTKVRINGREAPLFSVSNTNGQGQINLQVPFETPVGRATVEVDNNGSVTTVSDVAVHAIQPAIFEVDLLGKRYAAALHSDFRLVAPNDPARPGEVILMFLTSLGPLSPSLATNQTGPIPAAATASQASVGIDNAGVESFGAFYAPGLISVYQVNFKVPTDIATGDRVVNVVIGGESSQPALLPVRR